MTQCSSILGLYLLDCNINATQLSDLQTNKQPSFSKGSLYLVDQNQTKFCVKEMSCTPVQNFALLDDTMLWVFSMESLQCFY